MRRLLSFGLIAASLFASSAAAQQTIESLDLTVTTTPALSSDYLFRGISQTRNRPAVQISLDVQHGSGLYAGAFATNVAFQGTNARQEVDGLAGYRFDLLGISWDIGAIYYGYPGYTAQPGQYGLDYAEVMVKASRAFGPVKALATASWSPDFFGRSGNGYYVEGGTDITLPYEFTLGGRLGYQWIENNQRFGGPDYLWWSIGISRPLPGGFVLAVAWYDTDVHRSRCGGGQKICDSRAMVTLTRPF